MRVDVILKSGAQFHFMADEIDVRSSNISGSLTAYSATKPEDRNGVPTLLYMDCSDVAAIITTRDENGR